MVCEASDDNSMGTWRQLLPYYTSGRVVTGFGRGGKQLNCPTANLDAACVAKLPHELPTGVYYGWAVVDNSSVYPMCMSIGYNPQFHNKEKTMEVHIMHSFADDFYGATLRIAIVGRIRSMNAFSSLDALVNAIENDKKLSLEYLSSEPLAIETKSNEFLTTNTDVAPSG